ncbi:hypothetical protein ACFQRB_10385 [Halobaculum litoreum]|uniref:Uncharacterized protein n=1 Tax=Halobaculum litoreum TaxID=3031998 RepID=A0ABD5XT11_9EURY
MLTLCFSSSKNHRSSFASARRRCRSHVDDAIPIAVATSSALLARGHSK